MPWHRLTDPDTIEFPDLALHNRPRGHGPAVVGPACGARGAVAARDSIAIELATEAAIKHGCADEADCIEARYDLEAGIAAAQALGFVSSDDLSELARQLSPWYRSHRLRRLIDGGYTFNRHRLHRIESAHIARIDA